MLMTIAILCAFLFAVCYLGTGSDEKNIKSFDVYPDEVQEYVLMDPVLKELIIKAPKSVRFIINLIMFTCILLFFAKPLQTETLFGNFLVVLILGEVLNAFDYFVIDLMWWRKSKRVRFSGTENMDEEYMRKDKHRASFINGIWMFLIAAVIDALIMYFV